jgi:formate dehydrogenase iron-sulfur subunit
VRYLLPDEPLTTLDDYLATETGGLGLARAQELGPEATIDIVRESGLRGRGGAGFPTGRKWASVASGLEGTRYVVCNGAESRQSDI